MVVALDAHSESPAAPERDDTRVLAGSDDDAWPLGWELFQELFRALVARMLARHCLGERLRDGFTHGHIVRWRP